MIGISELSLIAILMIILFKPNDYRYIIKNIRLFNQKIRSYTNNLKNEIYDNEIQELENDFQNLQNDFININGKNYIYGEDRQLHEVYNLNDINFEKNIKKN